MESHMVKVCRQPVYRSIGHNIMRNNSDSASSDSSGSQSSPEYSQSQSSDQYEGHSSERDYWVHCDNQRAWKKPELNITQSIQDNIRENKNMDVSADGKYVNKATVVDENSVDLKDCEMVEVITINPLSACTDDDQDNRGIIDRKVGFDNGESLFVEDVINMNQPEVHRNNMYQDSSTMNFDVPECEISNVEEYPFKCSFNINAIDDVKNVDEYFTKEPNEVLKTNVDLLLKKKKLALDTDFRVSNTLPEQIFAPDTSTDREEEEVEDEVDEGTEDPVAEVSIPDLEGLPHIEDLERFLLDELPHNKLNSAQKINSVSLPQTPVHLDEMDIADARTCLSFEDLNLDLSDLTFENEKSKSATYLKSDEFPGTLTEEDINDFIISKSTQSKEIVKEKDNLRNQDAKIQYPIDSIFDNIGFPRVLPDRNKTSTPLPVLEISNESSTGKKEPYVKIEADDFVDIESCNDAVIPVLEANNLNSLLEQFEATEKLDKHKSNQNGVVKTKNLSISSGKRVQDAGVHVNKTKMHQISMPSTGNSVIKRSPSPLSYDHDYCSPKKKHSLSNLKGGQSLLKPEVRSNNNRILNSRHRSCKNKKIIYHLSSDDESEVNSVKKKKLNNRLSDSDRHNKKPSNKASAKNIASSNNRKKPSPARTSPKDNVESNRSVIENQACKASDTLCSQNCNSRIKLTIRNKSEVIINHCDVSDNHKAVIDKPKSSASSTTKLVDNVKVVQPLDSNKTKDVIKIDKPTTNVNSKTEDFYGALFNDKKDMRLPQPITINSGEVKKGTISESKVVTLIPVIEIEQPQKKKKLNLQEYKRRRGANSSSSSSTQVSPEAIFPDLSVNIKLDKNVKIKQQTPSNNVSKPKEQNIVDEKVLFDPIGAASRKILMNSKKQKAEAMRKRDEDIVMSKIPKVENFELQPLMTDAEMMKIVGMAPEMLPVPMASIPIIKEGKRTPNRYDEIILVSIGTNTDESLLKRAAKQPEMIKQKSFTPPEDSKSAVHFKIKKSDYISKHNVFDAVTVSKSPVDDSNRSDIKIDKARLKDITATLKSVEKVVDSKISSNSLFASIQDVVMKKAPSVKASSSNGEYRQMQSSSPVDKIVVHTNTKTTIIREYDASMDHGEDKIILHLEKNRIKPNFTSIEIQTEVTSQFRELVKVSERFKSKSKSPSPRKRSDSDMSLSSECSPVRAKVQNVSPETSENKSLKLRPETRHIVRSRSKEKRSRSRDRYDVKYRHSRSHSRGHRRKRSPSRNRSRSRGHYKRYRRSDSPYRSKRPRSPYRSRRSPSVRRDYRPKHVEQKSRSPISIKKMSPPNYNIEKVPVKSLTPPIRKPTFSECSSSSSFTSSTSSSNSSSTSSSSNSGSSCGSYRKDNAFRNKTYRSSYSSEDRESNTPVEERRIVFVGKLEKEMTKNALRAQFVKFGPIAEVRLHSKEDGSRYGFVTFQRPRDAWSAVESANTFPQYDVGFGGRRAFCRQSYADLDGLEAKYTESAFHGQPSLPVRRNDALSFEQMLLDVKKKLIKRKTDVYRDDTA